MLSNLEKEEIILYANQIVDGWVKLPGLKGYSYVGKEMPDWKKKPKGNNDLEGLFVLNRHLHWNVLMNAYKLTGDEKYAERVWKEFDNWVDNCICPPIILDKEYIKSTFDTYSNEELACWRSLEAGIRMFKVWCNITEYLCNSIHTTKSRLTKLYNAVRQHAEVLANVSPVLFPEADHNHYLMENIGLFMIGCTFTDLDNAEIYKQRGAEEISKCILRQFGNSGGQIEGCPYYHNECLELVLNVVDKMEKCDVTICEECIDRVRKALDYSIYATRPTGRVVAFGDSDPLYIKEFKPVYNKICEKNVSNFPPFFYERELGHVFFRSSWDDQAVSLAVICKAPVQNEHAHIDSCSFELTAYGKTMLIDPGRFTYTESELRRLFKSATFHNTLTVNGKEPFEYIGTWKYGEQKEAYISYVDDSKIIMQQCAYEPIIHQRTLIPHFHDDVKHLVIVDEITNLGESDYLEQFFHLDYIEYKDINQGIIGMDDNTSCIIINDERVSGHVMSGYVSERMDEKRDTMRYTCKISEVNGDIKLKTIVFLLDKKATQEDIKLCQGIYMADKS